MPKPERQQQVLDLLKELRGIEPLKELFWSELNYQRVNEPLSRRGWTETASKALADDPVLFAGGGEGNNFHVIYARLASGALARAFERPVVTKDFFREIANWYFWALKNVRFPKDAPKEADERDLWFQQHPEPFSDADWKEYDDRFGRKLEEWLDAGMGCRALARPDVRDAVRQCLTRFDGDRLRLHAAEKIEDSAIRERTLKDLEQQITNIEEAFEHNELDYGRKLYLIENCIYGVDIQPIAVQIAKMRFFISLIVDQKADPKADNLGIRTLPNLETKFQLFIPDNDLNGLFHKIEKHRQLEYYFPNKLIRTGESIGVKEKGFVTDELIPGSRVPIYEYLEGGKSVSERYSRPEPTRYFRFDVTLLNDRNEACRIDATQNKRKNPKVLGIGDKMAFDNPKVLIHQSCDHLCCTYTEKPYVFNRSYIDAHK